MAETLVLSTFLLSLLLCVVSGAPVLVALVFGFFLFFGYGLYRRHSFREMLGLAFSGVKTVRNILLTFVLIGMITALWRSCGTIPYIVYHSTKLCAPQAMVLISFLLCCMISLLTGTAFGTAATMGVICVTMANSMGVPVLYTGGAVLAGSFFGDRCSPMSTSALLVSSLTGTELFHNIAAMVKSAWIPFAVSCLFYALIGVLQETSPDSSGIQEIFAHHFTLHPALLLPAAVIVVFSLLRVRVKATMGVSIVCSAVVAVAVQGVGPSELLKTAVFGYQPADSALQGLLSGGGILSMTRVICIVCLSSCYAGMFNGTGLLHGLQAALERLSHRISPSGGFLVTAVLTSMISCNQTLAIMLTHQLCGELEKDPQEMALQLANTVVVIAPLIPWSIAGAVPLSSVGAPSHCILTACYLYLLPLWSLVRNRHSRRKGMPVR